MARRFRQPHALDVIIGFGRVRGRHVASSVNRIKIVQLCSMNTPWNSGIRALSNRFASSRLKLGRRIQTEDLRSKGAMFGPKILIWAEGRITLDPGGRSASGLPSLGRLVGIDSSVTVESVGLAVSFVGINSTAARTIDYLSKSRSRRVSKSLLVEVISSAFSVK
ncbi:hypothetical protein PS2_032062 [Malus domestica]